ncbi:hypothetical protein KR100_07825 [Synechococcus sp. KORDI-100]|nr:hypothetical protein KR100_07825 [Synechococcus sp. KORDI-100]
MVFKPINKSFLHSNTVSLLSAAMTTLKRLEQIAVLTGLGVLTLLPPPAFPHGKGIYDTKAEAEKRAREIGCEGVHENNGRWMPCLDEADLHKALRRQ